MAHHENEIILHIGAHRTGTTSFQRYLSSNRNVFSENGVSIFTPIEAREKPCAEWKIPPGRVIISEENTLGTMEDNIVNAKLYPHAEKNLRKLEAFSLRVGKVFLSIREPSEWWSSAISFCSARGMLKGLTLPNREEIVCADNHWSEIVKAARNSFPDAEIFVREFNWHPANPRWQLRNIAKWDFLSATSVDCGINNPRPDKNEVIAGLRENGTGLANDTYLEDGGISFFSEAERGELKDRYISEIESLLDAKEVVYIGEGRAKISKILTARKRPPSNQAAAFPKIAETTCFIHVGKTGGSYLKSLAGPHQDESGTGRLVLGNHSLTVPNSAEKYGSNRKLAFFFREPIERYISGFLSRMRQGRPVYDINWTAHEAISYSYFKSPNELAEALTSRSDRLVSAAKFAFSSILHLKLDGAYYFQSVERLRNEAAMGNIIVCCETGAINEHIDMICHKLGIPKPTVREPGVFDYSKDDSSQLSVRARRNLEAHLKNDYRLYAACREIADRIGFGLS